jgi:hypothetical protein
VGVCAPLKSGLALNILNFRKEDEIHEDEMGILAVIGYVGHVGWC